MFYNICLSGYDIDTDVIYLKFLLLRLGRNVDMLLIMGIIVLATLLYQSIQIAELKKEIRTKLLLCAKEEKQ